MDPKPVAFAKVAVLVRIKPCRCQTPYHGCSSSSPRFLAVAVKTGLDYRLQSRRFKPFDGLVNSQSEFLRETFVFSFKRNSCRASCPYLEGASCIYQARKKRKKINFWGPETGWGGGTRRGGGRKVRALPRKFVFLGLLRKEPGMSWEFCRDVPDPWGRSKSLCRKGLCAFFVPYCRMLFFSLILSFLEPPALILLLTQ